MSAATHGIVSLLDREHTLRVERLWRMLRERFGLAGVERTPRPHISYVVAECPTRPALEDGLAAIAAHQAPFTVRATGLGIFPSDHPVIYVPIVRDATLAGVHAAIAGLYDEETTTEHYGADRWLPHITLARGDVDADILAAVVGFLALEPIDWTIAIDNLTLIDESAGAGETVSLRLQRFELNARR